MCHVQTGEADQDVQSSQFLEAAYKSSGNINYEEILKGIFLANNYLQKTIMLKLSINQKGVQHLSFAFQKLLIFLAESCLTT